MKGTTGVQCELEGTSIHLLRLGPIILEWWLKRDRTVARIIELFES